MINLIILKCKISVIFWGIIKKICNKIINIANKGVKNENTSLCRN